MLQDGHYVGQQQDDQGYQSSLSSPNESQMKRSGSVFLEISFLPVCAHDSLAPTRWAQSQKLHNWNLLFRPPSHNLRFCQRLGILFGEVGRVGAIYWQKLGNWKQQWPQFQPFPKMWALDGETQFGGKASKYILLRPKFQERTILFPKYQKDMGSDD